MPLPSRAQVVVVGAGLAGLSAATRLAAGGLDVHVADAAGHVGGRLTTTRVDGFLVDRGFQVLNTGYPRVADLDLPALDLGWFWTGAVVRFGGRAHRVVDPRRHPSAALETTVAPLGSPLRKAAIAAFSVRAGYRPVPRLLADRERSAEASLRHAGVGPEALERFFRPFLAGVLLESRLETSSRYLDLLWRSFVRGRVGLPAAGMQSVGEQLADRLPAGRLHLDVRVDRVTGSSVHATAGTTTADAVVVATDPDTAAALVPGITASAPRQVTTHLHVLPASPWEDPLIVLGEPGGRLVNTVVVSDAQPAYSPDGRALVSSSTLAPTREAEVREEIARAHGVATGDLAHLTSVTVPGAQPAATPPLQHRRPVDLGGGLFVCGDHRDTPSIQGAMASGARTARAVLRRLDPNAPAGTPLDAEDQGGAGRGRQAGRDAG
jgi:phytoene dehydrogenase-like protein